MNVEGRGRLYVPTGLTDGPLPTHYEPVESPVTNLLYPKMPTNPVVKHWRRRDNPENGMANPQYPYVITTYRLTEHHVGGAMSRWLPWLSELQPALFAEISEELAAEKGVKQGDWITIWTERGEVEARALVTPRMKPLKIEGRTVHQIGLPYHWGYQGVVSCLPASCATGCRIRRPSSASPRTSLDRHAPEGATQECGGGAKWSMSCGSAGTSPPAGT